MIVPLSTKFTKDLHTYILVVGMKKIIIGNNNTQNNLKIVM